MDKETKNETSTRKMSQLKRWVIILIILILGVFAVSCTNAIGQSRGDDLKMIEREIIEYIDSPVEILPHDSIRNEMINITHEYITKITRGKADPNLATYLVDNALEHNIDIVFMMSQTKIETCFGTAGIGRSSSKKSLFGVMKRRYANYNEAITDYCKLLKKHYLTKGRTEKDLMRRYVTTKGARYAGNPTYEKELSAEYKRISKLTNLSNLQASYRVELLAYEALITNSHLGGDSIETTKETFS